MATYMEIKKLYNTDAQLVNAALNALYALGAEALRDNPPTADEVANGNLFDKGFLDVLLALGVKAFKNNPPTADEVADGYSEAFRRRVVDVAAMLADTDDETLRAVIRSVIAKFNDSDKAYVCPICGGRHRLTFELSEFDLDNWDEEADRDIPWECEICHAHGKSHYYSGDFGYHFDITDGDGNRETFPPIISKSWFAYLEELRQNGDPRVC